jgi:uncharacterized protein GlcG (DUF336 family)
MKRCKSIFSYTLGAALLGVIAVGARSASAQNLPDCGDLPNHAAVKAAITAAQAQANGGFGLDMWATVVDRDGRVCAVAHSGADRGEQWPGSRVISAQKANTANSFSLPGLALSTANLWAATQPGGSLFGLQFSNPVDTGAAYSGNVQLIGKPNDPMVDEKIGGVNVFGGGLALYDSGETLLGAVGVSGDSSCADHNIAWRVRNALGLDNVPGGVATIGDNMIFDIQFVEAMDHENHSATVSTSGFGHPECGVGDSDADDNAAVVAACPLGDGPTLGCV